MAVYFYSFEKQPVLSRKQESIVFLHSVGSTVGIRSTVSLLPPLALPPNKPSSPKPNSPLGLGQTKPRTVKSKATVLREYRITKGEPSSKVLEYYTTNPFQEARIFLNLYCFEIPCTFYKASRESMSNSLY